MSATTATAFGQFPVELWQDEAAASVCREMVTDHLREIVAERGRSLDGEVRERISYFAVLDGVQVPVEKEVAFRPPPKITWFGRMLIRLGLRKPPPAFWVGFLVSSETRP